MSCILSPYNGLDGVTRQLLVWMCRRSHCLRRINIFSYTGQQTGPHIPKSLDKEKKDTAWYCFCQVKPTGRLWLKQFCTHKCPHTQLLPLGYVISLMRVNVRINWLPTKTNKNTHHCAIDSKEIWQGRWYQWESILSQKDSPWKTELFDETTLAHGYSSQNKWAGNITLWNMAIILEFSHMGAISFWYDGKGQNW